MQRLLRPTVLGLATFVLMNLAGASLASRMTPPLDYYDWIAHRKADDVAALERGTGACIPIVVLGNSIAVGAADPAGISASLETPAFVYNGALYGTLASQDRQWANSVVVPALNPGTVIYVASAFAFSSETATSVEMADKWDHSLATKRGFFGTAERRLASILPLVRNRRRLSSFDEYEHLMGGDTPEAQLALDATSGLQQDGLVPVDRELPGDPKKRADLRNFVRNSFTRGWSVDPDEVEQLRQLARDLEKRGTDLILVIPPASEELPGLLPGGQRDFDEYTAAVRGVAADGLATLVDLTGSAIDPEMFYDHIHLGPRAREIFTADLASELDKVGISAECVR